SHGCPAAPRSSSSSSPSSAPRWRRSSRRTCSASGAPPPRPRSPRACSRARTPPASGCSAAAARRRPTSPRGAVVRGEWLREGALVLAIGANEPAARELDNVVLDLASFVCTDSVEQARLEAGDLIEPVERGVLDWLEVHELGQVVAGELRGREHDDDVVVFKSNGLAAWDVAAAARVVELLRGS